MGLYVQACEQYYPVLLWSSDKNYLKQRLGSYPIFDFLKETCFESLFYMVVSLLGQHYSGWGACSIIRFFTVAVLIHVRLLGYRTTQPLFALPSSLSCSMRWPNKIRKPVTHEKFGWLQGSNPQPHGYEALSKPYNPPAHWLAENQSWPVKAD